MTEKPQPSTLRERLRRLFSTARNREPGPAAGQFTPEDGKPARAREGTAYICPASVHRRRLELEEANLRASIKERRAKKRAEEAQAREGDNPQDA